MKTMGNAIKKNSVFEYSVIEGFVLCMRFFRFVSVRIVLKLNKFFKYSRDLEALKDFVVEIIYLLEYSVAVLTKE